MILLTPLDDLEASFPLRRAFSELLNIELGDDPAPNFSPLFSCPDFSQSFRVGLEDDDSIFPRGCRFLPFLRDD